jgi:hypothetical protein
MPSRRHTTLVPAVLALLLALAGTSGGTAAPAPAPAAVRPSDDAATRYLYRATWNGIPVARAELAIAPADGAAGRAVRLRGSARTNRFLDLFWRMRDRFDAVVAVDPPAPDTFFLLQNENRRRRETTIRRDQSRLVGRLERPGKKTKHGEAALHRALHDPASISYLIRTLPADVREPRSYEVFEGRKIYRLIVTPRGREPLAALGRTWDALKLHLDLELVPHHDLPPEKNKPPKVQRADLWVAAGAERVLLRMEAPTFWGWVAIQVVDADRGPPDVVVISGG